MHQLLLLFLNASSGFAPPNKESNPVPPPTTAALAPNPVPRPNLAPIGPAKYVNANGKAI